MSRGGTIVVGGILAPQCEHAAENSARAARAARAKGGRHRSQANKRGLSSHSSAKKALPCLRDRESERVGGKNTENRRASV